MLTSWLWSVALAAVGVPGLSSAPDDGDRTDDGEGWTWLDRLGSLDLVLVPDPPSNWVTFPSSSVVRMGSGRSMGAVDPPPILELFLALVMIFLMIAFSFFSNLSSSVRTHVAFIPMERHFWNRQY